MPKLLIGVGGVLTERQEKIIKDRITQSIPDVIVVVVPFMNGSVMIEDKYVRDVNIKVRTDGEQMAKTIDKSKK